MATESSSKTTWQSDLGPSRRTPWTANWVIVLLVIGGISLTAGAAVLFFISASNKDVGPKLTHRITRGDLIVTVTEQGTLESSENTEIICKVRGSNTVNWVVESGSMVQPGDELIRLETLQIEEQISERTKYALWSRSGAESWKAQVARRELAIPEYLEGRFVTQLMTLEKDLAISESNLRTAQNMLLHSQMMAERGYVSSLQIEQQAFRVTQFQLDAEVKKTEIDVLQRFTKKEELARLNGELKVANAQFEANRERAFADASRRDRAVEELKFCVIKAEKAGLVIHPSAARWKNAPEITEGGTVHKDQVLLLMPDLSKMQINVGIHESIIDRVEPGLQAQITLPGKTLDGEVVTVANVTRPAGWWTGNVVKYDTIIKLPPVGGLKPGMSAEVKVIIAHHKNVLKIPVAAVVETDKGHFCWVKTTYGPSKTSLQVGDSNDVYIEVKQGLNEGDDVVLNPIAFLEEAQAEAIKSIHDSIPSKSDKSTQNPKPKKPDPDQPASSAKPAAGSKPPAAKPQIKIKPK